MLNITSVASSVTLTVVGSGRDALPYLRNLAEARASVLIVASPGAGVATVLRSIVEAMPPLTHEQAYELQAAYKAAGLEWHGERPVRAPHHTISDAGLLDERGHYRRGELSLARHGALFLDDAIEFRRGRVAAAVKAADKVGAWVVGACVPCACGHAYHDQTRWPCTCTPALTAAWERRFGALVRDFAMSLHVR